MVSVISLHCPVLPSIMFSHTWKIVSAGQWISSSGFSNLRLAISSLAHLYTYTSEAQWEGLTKGKTCFFMCVKSANISTFFLCAKSATPVSAQVLFIYKPNQIALKVISSVKLKTVLKYTPLLQGGGGKKWGEEKGEVDAFRRRSHPHATNEWLSTWHLFIWWITH